MLILADNQANDPVTRPPGERVRDNPGKPAPPVPLFLGHPPTDDEDSPR